MINRAGDPLSRSVVRSYINERQALDKLVEATRRLADAEAQLHWVKNFPHDAFRQPPTISRENVLAELKARGIE